MTPRRSIKLFNMNLAFARLRHSNRHIDSQSKHTLETSSLSKGKADLLDTSFWLICTAYKNLLCNRLYFTYEAAQNGVLRTSASSLVVTPAEATIAPQVCLFIEKSP